MKTEFTKEFMTSNRGCYSREEVLNVKCVKDNNVTLENLFNDLPIDDFCWFFINKCELTTEQKQRFALYCAKVVLPIFEKERPNDKRVRECIETTELFLDGKATIEELMVKRAAADDAADDTANAYHAYYAAYTAYHAYANDDYYAYYAYYAANAANADDDDNAALKASVWEYVKTLS